MKKYLNIPQLNEKEVPPELDFAVLTAASARSRSIKFRRHAGFAALFAAAAAVMTVCSTLFLNISDGDEITAKPLYTQAELVAMGDFSNWEQEQFIYGEIADEYNNSYKSTI